MVAERSLGITFEGVVSSLGPDKIGGTEQCYSVNHLGGTGWLTNTAVSAVKAEAYSFAIDNAADSGGVGKFVTTAAGFYMGGGGPVVAPVVHFFLSTLFQGAAGAITDASGNPVDLR
jgi:hypothetical protein